MCAARVVSRSQLQQLVRPQLRDFWDKQRASYAGFFDPSFTLPDDQEVADFHGMIQFPQYTAGLFDCEDFGYLCKAEMSRQVRGSGQYTAPWAFGIAWGRFQWVSGGAEDHACNWFVGSDNRLRWFEPNGGTAYPPDACRGSLVLLLV